MQKITRGDNVRINSTGKMCVVLQVHDNGTLTVSNIQGKQNVKVLDVTPFIED